MDKDKATFGKLA